MLLSAWHTVQHRIRIRQKGRQSTSLLVGVRPWRPRQLFSIKDNLKKSFGRTSLLGGCWFGAVWTGWSTTFLKHHSTRYPFFYYPFLQIILALNDKFGMESIPFLNKQRRPLPSLSDSFSLRPSVQHAKFTCTSLLLYEKEWHSARKYRREYRTALICILVHGPLLRPQADRFWGRNFLVILFL